MGISTLLANRTVVLVVVAASGDKVPMGVAQVGTYDAVDTRLPSPPETFTGMHVTAQDRQTDMHVHRLSWLGS